MVYDSETIALAILLAGIVPGLFSLLSASFNTKLFVFSNFIQPAMRHTTTINVGHKNTEVDCDDCSRILIDHFQMSISRLGLSTYLSFLSVGLLSQSLLFLMNGFYLPGLSFLVYFITLLTFNLYSVMINKEVFHWWETPILKLLLMFSVLSASAFAAVKPESVSFLDYYFNKEVASGSIRLWATQVPVTWVQIALFSIAVAFIIIKIIQHYFYPTLRNIMLDLMDKNKDGFTADEWYNLVNAAYKDREVWTKPDVEQQIKKLVYQGLMKPEKIPDHSPCFMGPGTKYGKSL